MRTRNYGGEIIQKIIKMNIPAEHINGEQRWVGAVRGVGNRNWLKSRKSEIKIFSEIGRKKRQNRKLEFRPTSDGESDIQKTPKNQIKRSNS